MPEKTTAEPIGYLIVHGNPVDGFQFTGWWGTSQEAAIAGEQFDGDWWIAPLYAPADQD